jgi:cytochrome c oxidase subunit 1
VLREAASDGEGLHDGDIAEEHGDGHGIHMPSPSYYPLVASLGLPVLAYGMIYKTWYVAALGALGLVASLYGWALEPQTEPTEPTEPDQPMAELEPATP